MWQILIHPLVFKEDFKNIDRSHQKRIIKAIRKKLTANPKAYGKALVGPLKGYWRLRVDDYRVVYSILEKQIIVKVIKIGIRRDSEIYEEMLRRIPFDLSSQT